MKICWESPNSIKSHTKIKGSSHVDLSTFHCFWWHKIADSDRVVPQCRRKALLHFYDKMNIGFIVGIARLVKGMHCCMFLTMHSVFILLTATYVHQYNWKSVESLWQHCWQHCSILLAVTWLKNGYAKSPQCNVICTFTILLQYRIKFKKLDRKCYSDIKKGKQK